MFDCPLCEVFIEYRPTVYISQNNPKQGLLGIIYIFHVPVIKNMFPYRICGNRKLLANNGWTRVRNRYNQCFRLPIFTIRATNGNQKLCFFTFFGLRSSIILTFSIAAYLVWIRCTFHDATVDIFCIQLNKIIWDCLCLKGRYITMTI